MKAQDIRTLNSSALKRLTSQYKKEVVPKLRRLSSLDVQHADFFWAVLYGSVTPAYQAAHDSDQTRADKAVLGASVIFSAIHYNTDSLVSYDLDEGKSTNMGAWLRIASMNASNRESFDAKVLDLLSQSSVDAVFRKLLSLVRQNKKVLAKIDYNRLASDLYLIQTSYQQDILFSWGKSYYMNTKETS